MTIKSIRSCESWHLAKSFSNIVADWELLGFIILIRRSVTVVAVFILDNGSLIMTGGIVEDRDQKDICKGNLITKAKLASSLRDTLLEVVETLEVGLVRIDHFTESQDLETIHFILGQEMSSLLVDVNLKFVQVFGNCHALDKMLPARLD